MWEGGLQGLGWRLEWSWSLGPHGLAHCWGRLEPGPVGLSWPWGYLEGLAGVHGEVRSPFILLAPCRGFCLHTGLCGLQGGLLGRCETVLPSLCACICVPLGRLTRCFYAFVLHIDVQLGSPDLLMSHSCVGND